MGKNNKEEGEKRKETSTSRLLEIIKGRRMREEQRLKASAKGNREKKKQKGERENVKEARDKKNLFGKSGSGMQHRSAGEEYEWKANYGAKANRDSCFWKKIAD